MIISNLPVVMAQHRIRTLQELHRRTGIARSTLTSLYYGKGEAVRFSTLETLCGFFNVGVGDLLFFKGEN